MPAARPVMFCSATPALTKRSGKRSANGSITLKPRSPTTSAILSCAAASATSSSMKASRIGRLPDLGQRLFELLGRGVAIMPEHLILHEADALAFGGVGDQQRGLAGFPR